MNVIEIHELEKTYGKKRAVHHFDMQVKKGDVYGFVGRNGAGKSSVMKMIAGLAHPSSGQIQVFGKPVEQSNLHGRIGVLIENPGLYPRMSAYDNMMLKALCLGIVDPKKKVIDLLNYVGLGDVGKKGAGQFSMGMKQRLGLAQALLGDPEILLLDEPLNGLDPEGVREIRQLIQTLNEEQGITVLISSHILEQLGKVATRYGVIREGRMVRELSASEVEEECRDFVQLNVVDPSVALAVLTEHIPDARFTAMPDGSIRISDVADISHIGEVLKKESIAIHGLQTHKRDLEEFFVELMGAEYHD